MQNARFFLSESSNLDNSFICPVFVENEKQMIQKKCTKNHDIEIILTPLGSKWNSIGGFRRFARQRIRCAAANFAAIFVEIFRTMLRAFFIHFRTICRNRMREYINLFTVSSRLGLFRVNDNRGPQIWRNKWLIWAQAHLAHLLVDTNCAPAWTRSIIVLAFRCRSGSGGGCRRYSGSGWRFRADTMQAKIDIECKVTGRFAGRSVYRIAPILSISAVWRVGICKK